MEISFFSERTVLSSYDARGAPVTSCTVREGARAAQQGWQHGAAAARRRTFFVSAGCSVRRSERSFLTSALPISDCVVTLNSPLNEFDISRGGARACGLGRRRR